MQELDTLGRRSQTADGGWMSSATRRRKGRRIEGGGRGQEGSNGRGGGEALSREGRSAYYCGCGLLVEIRCGGGSEAFGVWLTRQRASSFEEGPGDVSLKSEPSKARREVVTLGAWRCSASCVWLPRRRHCAAISFLLRLVTRLYVLRRLVLRLLL